jgi:hypothetical protein
MKRLRLWAFIWIFFTGASTGWAQVPKGFDKTLSLQGVQFRVTSANQGSVNTLKIVASGRLSRKVTLQSEVDGTVTGAEVADLDGNGWPEIYVYVTSSGSGSFGSVVAHAVNRGKSITPIFLPDLTDDPAASQGYLGHDRFAVEGQKLVRRFPVYLPGDSNAAPTGGERQLHYQLVAGEASWQLKTTAT